MSSSDDEFGYDRSADELNVWPAFVDLLAATTLLFITLIAVFTFVASKQLNDAKTQRHELYEKLRRAQGSRNLYTLRDDSQFVRITMQAETTFPRGRWEWSTLQETGKIALGQIGKILGEDSVKALYREVRVLGHTDQDPYPQSTISNWELSAARAAVVARFLVEGGIMDPCKISAVGRGAHFPLSLQSPSSVPLPRRQAMALNRRIELEIVPARAAGATHGAPCLPEGDRTYGRR